jgi:small redox-active disulfide protein 2
MIIKVLGSGCKNCKKLTANALQAIEELGINASLEKVEEMKDIMKYNVLSTPALVVDEVVKTTGRIPSVEEIKTILKSV